MQTESQLPKKRGRVSAVRARKKGTPCLPVAPVHEQLSDFRDIAWGTGLFCPRSHGIADAQSMSAAVSTFGVTLADSPQLDAVGCSLRRVIGACIGRALRGGSAPDVSVFRQRMEARFPLRGHGLGEHGGKEEVAGAEWRNEAGLRAGGERLCSAVRNSCRAEVTVVDSSRGHGYACTLSGHAHGVQCATGSGVPMSDVDLYDQSPSVQWSGRVCGVHAVWIWSHWVLYCLPLIAYHSARMLVHCGRGDGAVFQDYARKLEKSVQWAWTFTEKHAKLARG